MKKLILSLVLLASCGKIKVPDEVRGGVGPFKIEEEKTCGKSF